jgi:hypothetical protein
MSRHFRAGRFVGKTVPQIALSDHDWLFDCEERGYLTNVQRFAKVCTKARKIRFPQGQRGPRVADYVAHANGKLSHAEVGYPDQMSRDEDRGVTRLLVFDLSFARKLADYDKLGAQRSWVARVEITQVRRGAGAAWARSTAARLDNMSPLRSRSSCRRSAGDRAWRLALRPRISGVSRRGS